MRGYRRKLEALSQQFMDIGQLLDRGRAEKPSHFVAIRKQSPEKQQAPWFKKPESILEVAILVRATKT